MKQKTSAPGKIILLGEHAAVYGMPAIAVPISTLRACAAIKAKNIPLIIRSADFAANPDVLPNPLERMRALALDYFQIPHPRGEITIRSDIPIARGLGSGAAVSAALGRAIAMLLGRVIPNDVLNRLVFEVEKIHHRTPSGIDNTVVVYERSVYFVKDQPIETLEIKQPLHILIADTGQAALTREAVAKVRQLYQRRPIQTQTILKSIGLTVEQARVCIRDGDHVRLGELMTENQQQLQWLNVSSSKLDRLVDSALAAGALGAKLSGGGLGGNMIALVKKSRLNAVKEALIKSGAVSLVATAVK